MNAVMAPRPDLSPYAPKITSLTIPVDKIRDVIGPGGKVIRAITAESGATIDVEDDGTVRIAAVDQAAGDKALRMIREIVAEPEMGEVYEGIVRRITNFGAFVQILPNKDGLLHVSEIAHHRISNVADVLKEGDTIQVKVIGIDRKVRVRGRPSRSARDGDPRAPRRACGDAELRARGGGGGSGGSGGGAGGSGGGVAVDARRRASHAYNR
jgi:polyribonucleotide nucleotidyltransferase